MWSGLCVEVRVVSTCVWELGLCVGVRRDSSKQFYMLFINSLVLLHFCIRENQRQLLYRVAVASAVEHRLIKSFHVGLTFF